MHNVVAQKCGKTEGLIMDENNIEEINNDLLRIQLDEQQMKNDALAKSYKASESYYKNELKRTRRWRVAIGAICLTVGLCLGSLIAGILVLRYATNSKNAWIIEKKEGEASVAEKVADKLNALQAVIDYMYLDDYDEESIEEGIYKGYVESLGDPYSVYYTKEEYSDLLESSSGAFFGIGVYVAQNPDTNEITIMSVIEDSPAEEAGLLSGDIIKNVAGKDVSTLDVNTVVSMIKGEEGETVKITVSRKVDDKVSKLDFNVERREVEVKTVSYQMLDGNIGYIRIAEFESATVDQFKEAIDDLNKQKMKGLVVDLRDNPGGLLDSVCDILDYILPEGLLVYTEDKYGEREEYSSDKESNLDVPLAVLVNGNSASASEVFSGAIQDYNAGKLIGTKTFGKGIVQAIRSFSDGSGIKITISKYYTPNGRNIHGTGLEPDVEVELDENLTVENYSLETDNQLQTAIDEIKKSSDK